MKLFEENEAIAFIRSKVNLGNCDDDDILDVIDFIYDFYDEHGFLEIDCDDDVDDDSAAIALYVNDNIGDTPFSKNTINSIVRAELDYETSLLD